MPRPNKLRTPTRTLNCILTRTQYERLSHMAQQHSIWRNGQISMSDLVREAIQDMIDREDRQRER